MKYNLSTKVKMPCVREDIYSDDQLDLFTDNCTGKYINDIDINYNRTLKNYPLTLKKIDEVDETSIKSPEPAQDNRQDENGNVVHRQEPSKTPTNRIKDSLVTSSSQKEVVTINDGLHRPRPKSASSAPDDEAASKEKTLRPKSSCARYSSRIPVKEPIRKGLKNFVKTPNALLSEIDVMRNNKNRNKILIKNDRSLEELYCISYEDYITKDFMEELVNFDRNHPLRPSSACSMRPDLQSERLFGQKRSNSQPNLPRNTEARKTPCEFSRFRRSLRLLGFSNSDIGLPDSPKYCALPSRPRTSQDTSPTFSTRLMERSISLDCIRVAVRHAIQQHHPGASQKYNKGLPQRRLLAQAAYEEWYFKKAEEYEERLKDEREKNKILKEKFEKDEQSRKEKAGEKFQKWIETKEKEDLARKRKRTILSEKLNNKLVKSREEIDKAYLNWKKLKQEDLQKKKRKELEEMEKKEREDAAKLEKKAIAEKVFLEWKKKTEETMKKGKEKENKKERELREKIKNRISDSGKPRSSYASWKQQKDNEIRAKCKQVREATKHAEDTRSMIATERMYEAEQAFEEWLDKKDSRQQKTHETRKTTVPWAP